MLNTLPLSSVLLARIPSSSWQDSRDWTLLLRWCAETWNQGYTFYQSVFGVTPFTLVSEPILAPNVRCMFLIVKCVLNSSVRKAPHAPALKWWDQARKTRASRRRDLQLSTMEEKFNRLIFIPIAAVLFLMIGYQYVCPADSNTCYFTSDEKGLFTRYSPGFELVYNEPEPDDDVPSKITSRFNFSERDLDRHVEFNIREDDVMVFLHIQKTGGTTFGRHLVKNIQLEQPCDCMPGQRKCTCHRPGRAESWLFSRFSTGWSCGLHADWTELTSCVPVVMNKRDKKSAAKSKRSVWRKWSPV